MFISQNLKNLQFKRMLVASTYKIGLHYLMDLLDVVQFSRNRFYLNKNHGQSFCTNFTTYTSFLCTYKRDWPVLLSSCHEVRLHIFLLLYSICFKHYILSYSLKPLNLPFKLFRTETICIWCPHMS